MGYTSKERKARLNRIVEATSRRMTVSKLIDEAVEMVLPRLEAKYGVLEEPTHEAPRLSRKKRVATA